MKRRSFFQKSVVAATLTITTGLANAAGGDEESSSTWCGRITINKDPQGHPTDWAIDCTSYSHGCLNYCCGQAIYSDAGLPDSGTCPPPAS